MCPIIPTNSQRSRLLPIILMVHPLVASHHSSGDWHWVTSQPRHRFLTAFTVSHILVSLIVISPQPFSHEPCCFLIAASSSCGLSGTPLQSHTRLRLPSTSSQADAQPNPETVGRMTRAKCWTPSRKGIGTYPCCFP